MPASVMVVDDDDGVLYTLLDVLALSNRETCGADNGEEALRLLEIAERPCLVLLDIRMPGISGLDVLDCIRSMRDKMIDVVIMTADRKEKYQYLIDAGIGVLQKPFDMRQLERLVREKCAHLDNIERKKIVGDSAHQLQTHLH